MTFVDQLQLRFAFCLWVDERSSVTKRSLIANDKTMVHKTRLLEQNDS